MSKYRHEVSQTKRPMEKPHDTCVFVVFIRRLQHKEIITDNCVECTAGASTVRWLASFFTAFVSIVFFHNKKQKQFELYLTTLTLIRNCLSTFFCPAVNLESIKIRFHIRMVEPYTRSMFSLILTHC